MKQLYVVVLLVILAGCAKVNTNNGYTKGEILLKIDGANVKTVLYQGVASDGKPFFKYPATTFMEVLQFSAPEVYAAARETLGFEVFSYELRKYDLNQDNLLTIEEFKGVLGETEFTDEDINKFTRDFMKAYRKESAGFGNKSRGGKEKSL